jgi:hypothetical protein
MTDLEFDEALQAALVPPDLRALGWRYVDPPTKFSYEMWDYFRALIGMEEHKLLIYSDGIAPDGFKWKRGQFVISPQGMKNLADKERAAKLSTPASA